jgi:hypothetical protein
MLQAVTLVLIYQCKVSIVAACDGVKVEVDAVMLT